jgi:hypothetical protein
MLDEPPLGITDPLEEARRISFIQNSRTHFSSAFREPSMPDTAALYKLGSGGQLSTTNRIDLENSFYDVFLEMEDLDISLIRLYFDPYIELNKLAELFNSSFRVHGSWEDTDVLDLGGTFEVNGLEMTDCRDDRVLALDRMKIDVDTVVMKEALYNIDHIKLDGFYGLYEMYDDGDNWSNMLIASTDSAVADSVGSSEAEVEIITPIPFGWSESI